VVRGGGGRLRIFRDETASMSDSVLGVCQMIGGVERWWEVDRIQR
jgi:hypothetical protein